MRVTSVYPAHYRQCSLPLYDKCAQCGRRLPLTPAGLCVKCLDRHYEGIDFWAAYMAAKKHRSRKEARA